MGKLTTAALAMFTVAGLSLVAAPAAQAAAPVTAAAGALGNAPDCVAVWHKVGNITKTGYARNDCQVALNLKIVWAHGGDGPCQTVAPGRTLSHKIPRGPRTFDGANSC